MSPVLRLIVRTVRFVRRRVVVFLVNMLAVPPEIMAFQTVRCLLMRLIGTQIGPRSQLSESLYIYDGRNVRTGARCKIGSFCRIWDFSAITIGDDLLASHGLTLISGTHFVDQERTLRPGPIFIGNNVWIGINVTIVGPASVGDNVVIGANSLVLGSLQGNAVYAGSPAKLVRDLDSDRIEKEHS